MKYKHEDGTPLTKEEFLKKLKTDKEFTEKDYEVYMRTVDRYIKNAEIAINELPKLKEVSKLSFEDWVKWQKGEYK
jgi:hypothetical protein